MYSCFFVTYNFPTISNLNQYNEIRNEILININNKSSYLMISHIRIPLKLSNHLFTTIILSNIDGRSLVETLDNVIYPLFQYQYKINKFISDITDNQPLNTIKTNPMIRLYPVQIKSADNFKVKIEKLILLIDKYYSSKYNLDNYNQDKETLIKILDFKTKLNINKRSNNLSINNVPLLVSNNFNRLTIDLFNFIFTISYAFELSTYPDVYSINIPPNILKLLVLNKPAVLEKRLLQLKTQTIQRL